MKQIYHFWFQTDVFMVKLHTGNEKKHSEEFRDGGHWVQWHNCQYSYKLDQNKIDRGSIQESRTIVTKCNVM